MLQSRLIRRRRSFLGELQFGKNSTGYFLGVRASLWSPASLTGQISRLRVVSRHKTQCVFLLRSAIESSTLKSFSLKFLSELPERLNDNSASVLKLETLTTEIFNLRIVKASGLPYLALSAVIY